MENSFTKLGTSNQLAVYVENFTEQPIQVTALTKSESICVAYMQPLVNGIKNSKIKETTVDGLTSFIGSLVEMVQVRTGYKNIFGSKEEDIEKNKQLFIEALIEDIHISFGDLRQLELREAIRRGANKMYLDDKSIFIVSPSEFMEWIKSYIAERSGAIIRQRDVTEKEQSNNSLLLPQSNDYRERCENILQHIKECYNQNKYVCFGQLNLLAGSAYEFLQNNGIITISDNQKREYMDKAMEMQFSELVANKLVLMTNKDAKEFLKMWQDAGSDVSPRNRVNKENNFYKIALSKAKKICFEEIVFTYTVSQWIEKFNTFLKEKNYTPIQ